MKANVFGLLQREDRSNVAVFHPDLQADRPGVGAVGSYAVFLGHAFHDAQVRGVIEREYFVAVGHGVAPFVVFGWVMEKSRSFPSYFSP
jgi:hypothetical protein